MSKGSLQVLDPISLELDPKEIIRILRLKSPKAAKQAEHLVEVVRPLIAARAAFRVAHVDEKIEDAVFIGGIRFASRVLRKNLHAVGRVFPYVVTIGDGLDTRDNATAYSDVFVHLIRRKASTCSEGNRPAVPRLSVQLSERSDAGSFHYFSEPLLSVKCERNFRMDSPFRLIL